MSELATIRGDNATSPEPPQPRPQPTLSGGQAIAEALAKVNGSLIEPTKSGTGPYTHLTLPTTPSVYTRRDRAH